MARYRRRTCGREAHPRELKYVVAIALSYRRYGLRLADLVSEGNLGLMMAMRKFDPERGVRFVTYAAYWSRAYILNYVIKSWSMVGGAPGRSARRCSSSCAASARWSQSARRGRRAEVDGDARRADRQTVEKTKELTRRLEARDVSLDVQQHEEGRMTLLDGLQDGSPTQEERFFDEKRDAVRIRRDRGRDARRSREVHRRAAADGRRGDLLAEIGRQLGVRGARGSSRRGRRRS